MKQEKKKNSRNSERSLTTPECRLAFVHVFKPSAMKGAEPKFSVTMLFPKKTDLSKIKLALKHAKIDEWGPDADEWPEGLHSPVQDGDAFPQYQGFAGHWAVKATSGVDFRPAVVGPDMEEIIDPSKLYAGCYARASIYARAWEFGNKQGVQFILDGVQKIRDGTPFGGRKGVDQMFGRIESEESSAAEDEDDSSF
jgi:Protein of unknown function (DUF2815)